MFAVAGSKFDGTGFEKLQIVHTHVAVLAGVGSGAGGLKGPSDRCRGEDVPFLDGGPQAPGIETGERSASSVSGSV